MPDVPAGVRAEEDLACLTGMAACLSILNFMPLEDCTTLAELTPSDTAVRVVLMPSTQPGRCRTLWTVPSCGDAAGLVR